LVKTTLLFLARFPVTAHTISVTAKPEMPLTRLNQLCCFGSASDVAVISYKKLEWL